MTVTSTVTDPLHWMPDYCPRCNPLGHHADSCTRERTMAEPEAIEWHGGKGLIVEYRCARCDYQWQRADLWDAREAGFTPRQDRKVVAA